MNIVTLNCRGLNNPLKRKMVFSSLEKASIACLQETYITESNCKQWASDWNGEFFYHFGSTHSNGLIILVNKRLNIDNLTKIIINERCLGISFKFLKMHFTLFNIYAPANREYRIPFFAQLSSTLKLKDIPHDSFLILAGDFNTYVSDHLDNIRGVPHSEKEIDTFNGFIQSNFFSDCWRVKNQDIRDFSWIRYITVSETDPSLIHFSARRLDFILCSNNLLPFLNSSKMQHISSTDHKLVSAFFQIDSFPRGPGRWQFNDSLLDDDFFFSHLSDFITSLKSELNKQNSLDKRLYWDILKVSIKDEVIAYSRMKFIEKVNDNLDSEIESLNKNLVLDPCNQAIISKLNKISHKKELIDISTCRGALKRSKIKFIEEGERNTKMFLSIEKNKQTNSTIRSVYDSKNDLVFSPSLILHEISKFYKTLLNPENNPMYDPLSLKDFIKDSSFPKIDEIQRALLESPLIISEFEKALHRLNRESSPGIDGLTPLFYIYFWDIIKVPYFECITESVQYKLLSLSQRRAILSLLPKGTNIDLNYLSNWRPISLLCTDSKIYSRVLATRLESVLDKLIHPNQAGYVRGRSITDHLRLCDDILNYTNQESIPGILVSLDFRKAFDTISKSSIIAALQAFGFGPCFIGYVETILNGSQTCIKNGGWMSSFFDTQRGVRQGCSFSPLLFIVVVEFLSIRIREDNEVLGIFANSPHFSDNKLKCLSYADDMDLFLKNVISFNKSLSIIKDFKRVTGLDLNLTKCLGLGLGGLVIENPETEGITWLNEEDNIRLLGVFFNAKREASLIEQNHENKIKEIREVLSYWARRNVSLLGKGLVNKIHVLSKINNIIQPLSLPTTVLETIDKLMFSFLWSNDIGALRVTERVKRNVLCLPVEEGGIDMISVCDQQTAMLVSWLQKRSLLNNKIHLAIVNFFLKSLGGIEYINNCNASTFEFGGLKEIKSYYWKAVIQAWVSIDKSGFTDSADLENQPLFNNTNLIYRNKTLYIKRWLLNGIKHVKDIFDGRNFKSLPELKNNNLNYPGLILDYNAIKTAIINYNKKLNHTDYNSMKMSYFVIPKLGNKILRNILVRQRLSTNKLVCVSAWKRKLNFNIQPYFAVAKTSTKETKLRGLHFKILHRIFPCNFLLHKMKIKLSPLCESCSCFDTIEHFFYECESLRTFWEMVEDFLAIILNETFNITLTHVLFGLTKHDVESNTLKLAEANRLLLVAKYCIHKMRYIPNANIMQILNSEISLRKRVFNSFFN